jgi:AraC-like DNA-binding protein
MVTFKELLTKSPIIPFIRQADFSVNNPYQFGERRLLDYLLIYIQEGEFNLYVEDRRYELNNGDFCLVKPGELHCFEGRTATILPFMHLDFFYNPLRELSFPTKPGQCNINEFAELQQPNINEYEGGVIIPTHFKPSRPEYFRDTMFHAIRLWNQRDFLSQLEAGNLSMDLVMELIRTYWDYKVTYGISRHDFSWVPSYLSLHISESVHIKQLADLAGLSESRFSLLFRRTYRMPLHRYLLNMRIDHSRELLRSESLSVTKIAEYCGFSSIHHFTKLFKQATGFSPTSYRAQH